MAGEAIKQLEEQLNCSICLDIYTDPKVLQCLHTYCRKCLERLVFRDQQGELSLTCPTCRQITSVPANGVMGLQSAFKTKEFLRIRDSLVKKRDMAASLQGGATSLTPLPKKAISTCYEHIDKERELYCETCSELICWKCAIKGGKHHSHDYDELKSAYERYKGEARPSLKLMEGKLNTVKKALAQLDIRCEEVSNQQTTIEASIHNIIKRLQESLDARKTELISDLHQKTQGKLKDLATQRDEMETIMAQLSSCYDHVKKSFETGSQEEVLMTKRNLVKQVKIMNTSFQPDILKPNTEADIRFLSSPDLTTTFRNYGKLYAAGDPDPLQCQATGKGLEAAVVGEMFTTTLQAISYKGEAYEKSVKPFDCEFVSEITGAKFRGIVERRGQNKYEIGYQPTIRGRHHLNIKVEDQHIRGSPFSVEVKLPIEKLGNPILTIDRVNGPWGVAVTQSGEVVITERDRHCVSVVSWYGKKLQSFGTRGSGHGQFNEPRGVAIDGEGSILVADTANGRLQKFTTTGKFLTAVGTEGSGPLQFNVPLDVTFNPTNNKVYVVDQFNNRVQVLNSDLTFSSTFGKEGSGKGQFEYPWGIACDSSGEVYVTDTENNRIQIFTADGKFVRMFGRKGQGKGELDRPAGITIDTNDVVYVSEYNNGHVSVFTCGGQFVTSFGRNGEGSGEFNYPVGLTIDNSGLVCVCDRDNNRIQFF